MKTLKKLLLATSCAALLFATGCQSTTSNTITFTTPAPTAMFNTQNQTAMVNVMTQDLRQSAEIANYTKGGDVVRLTALPEVGQLFQQVMQQNLNSKGFAVVQGAGNANVLLNVRKFFATVESGNLRHSVNAEVTVEVSVQGAKGNFSKTFNAARGQEGALSANNDDIQKVLALAYEDIVRAIYNDNEIGNAIHQYK